MLTVDGQLGERQRGRRRSGSARGSAAGLMLLVGLVLAGCNGNPLQLVAAGCMPGEVPRMAASAGSSGGLDVYLDVSRSATNFGEGNGASFYRDLIGWVLAAGSEFPETRMFGFADRVGEIDVDGLRAAARGAVNPCAQCGFRESRLDDVLDRVANETSVSVALVITDLWVDNPELIGRWRLALGSRVRRILADGRAIGLLGAPAPYSGEVYDVPGRAGVATIPAGRIEQRPLFALLIGGPREVIDVRDRLVRELFADQEERALVHFSLFTPTLVPAGPIEHRLVARGPGVRPTLIFDIEGLNVPQLGIDGRITQRNEFVDDDGRELATFSGAVAPVVPGDGQRHAPAPSAYELDAEAWTLTGADPVAACEPGAWQRVGVGRTLQVFDGASGSEISLDASHPDLRVIRRGEIVFIQYRLRVGLLQRGDSSTEWIDDWSFREADAEGLLADPPALFPALNATDFRELLETTMREHVEGETVAYGSILLSVD